MLRSRLFSSSLRPQCRLLFSTPVGLSRHHARPKTKIAPPPKVVPPPKVEAETPDLLNTDSAFEPPPGEAVFSSRNQIIFVGLVSSGVYLWAAARTNADTEAWAARVAPYNPLARVNTRAIMEARLERLVKTLRNWGMVVVEATQSLSDIPRTTIRQAYGKVASRFANASDAQRTCYYICALNGAVFLAWRVPGLGRFMHNNFVHHPLSGRSTTLLTSVFSHSTFFHLLFNSMALTSFGYSAGKFLERRQADGSSARLESNVAYHFFAFFVAAGLCASLASHVVRVGTQRLLFPTLSKAAQDAARIRGGSLGASGAIYATVTLTAMANPDTYVTPIFLNWPIPIQYGVGGMMMLDLVGLLRGWRMFDHVAHLGGAVFGIMYYYVGPRIWDSCRDVAAYFNGKNPPQKY
ncbi:hypothetical protein FB45DRAFT_925016 [Roridomyces roridus]|uniref:Peptidase S54 rhomboid domain-containing protein n=1 Tax=Roridomyces roridus TaxID=1738132 RepID=A0AAD7FIY0_9AGAR|nr:hypothetical protein FB45DRAFT_925016 [Roridomyces roridus]